MAAKKQGVARMAIVSDPVVTAFVTAMDAVIGTLIVSEAGDRTKERLAVSSAEIRGMVWLGRHGPALMGEFAEGLAIPLSTATRIVTKLVVKDLLVRKRPEGNRRVVRIDLSRSGRRIDDGFYQMRLRRSADLLSTLNESERSVLISLLHKLAVGHKTVHVPEEEVESA